ncbi:MAG: DUF4493 domain-containing protein [Alistipes sp.]|nr:DUF4493 domain-containing protein [Alistipes sp.]
MKFLKFTAIATAVAIMVTGCAEHQLGTNTDPGTDLSDNVGYLSVSGLSADCRIDERDAEYGTSATRSRTIDVNEFVCRIINDKDEEVLNFKLGERPAEQIPLPTGDYILNIASGEVPGAAWDTPVYGCTEPFKINRREVTTLDEVVCTLLNIKVTVEYSVDLLERLGEKTTTTAKIGENAMEFVLTEKRAAFFFAPNVENTIELVVSGTYAADKTNYKNIEMTKTVSGVKAGQHSKILFFIANANEGSIEVGVTVRDWVTDEIIPCDVKDLVAENEWKEEDEDDPIVDTADPSIVWDGYDISKRYSLSDVKSVDLLVNSTKGISGFTVQIISDTLTAEELAKTGLCDVMNLCYPTKSYDSRNPDTYIDVEQPLRDLSFVVGEDVIGKNFVKLSITQFLGILQTVSSPGHRHDFVLTVTDAAGTITVRTLKLQTGPVTEEPIVDPAIEWVGYNIDKQEAITTGMTVDLHVTASKGIKAFVVRIQSDVLTPEELAKTGLCDVLNLCYPKQSYDSGNVGTYIDVEQPLRDLNFAVGDDVLNKNDVTLSITSFLSILQTVSGSDVKNHNFVIMVTDNEDNMTTKTLMLQTGK